MKHKLSSASLCTRKLSCTDKISNCIVLAIWHFCMRTRAFSCTMKHEKSRVSSCTRKHSLRKDESSNWPVQAGATVCGNSRTGSQESVCTLLSAQELSCALKRVRIGPCKPMRLFAETVAPACKSRCALFWVHESFLVHLKECRSARTGRCDHVSK